jgi:hypothetical protein
MFLTDKYIDSAKASLDLSEGLLSTLNDKDMQAKQIIAKHKELLTRRATFKEEQLAAMKAALPGIFSVLSQTYDDTHPVLPSNFMEVDDSIARVNVALDYTYVRNTTTETILGQRLDKKQTDLIRLLATRDWRSLQTARALVQQMRENIYLEDLLEDLTKNKAAINTDQQVARPYLPVEFCICFQRAAYNHAQALELLTCQWKFDDGLTETGWAVCHFFQDSEKKYNVTATVPCPDESQGSDITVPPKEISVRGRNQFDSKSKWFAEGLRFAIAFFIALAGLVAGAQDQLAKLDIFPAILAVFFLGFGADSIKNLLAQPAPAVTKP